MTTHDCQKGQEVLLKGWVGKYGKVNHVIAEPDGDDSVIVDLEPVRCRASDLEVIPALPTPEGLKADHDRRGAVIDRFLSNPSDPHSLEELRGVLRELGWLRKK